MGAIAMMGHRENQIEIVMMDIGELIPEYHLLKRIEKTISFAFIYELMKPYYSDRGRPSIDPVSIIKMLLIGYLYGIKSERRLVEEIQLNIGYRWFCGFQLSDKIPDHSLFSQNRRRKWKNTSLFEDIFFEVVKKCIAVGLVDGETMASDGSFLPSDVSRDSWIDVEHVVTKSMHSYLDALDEELACQPGFKNPPERDIIEKQTTSSTDPEAGYINHGTKRGIGYLLEATVDCKHGIITGVDVYPANEKESLKVLRHLEKQQLKTGLQIKKLALDRGYDTGAVHRGLELLGIEGYIPGIDFPNSPHKYGFIYNENKDCFICPEDQELHYHRLNCNKSTGKYLRCYQTNDEVCKMCPRRQICFDTKSTRRRILASGCYPAFHRGHKRIGTQKYMQMMRLRKIWIEGRFSVLKREHLLKKVRKRGISNANEECLLSALALNLKRMATAFQFRCAFLLISISQVKICNFVNRSRVFRKLVYSPWLLKSSRNIIIVVHGIKVLHIHVFFVAPLRASHMA